MEVGILGTRSAVAECAVVDWSVEECPDAIASIIFWKLVHSLGMAGYTSRYVLT